MGAGVDEHADAVIAVPHHQQRHVGQPSRPEGVALGQLGPVRDRMPVGAIEDAGELFPVDVGVAEHLLGDVRGRGEPFPDRRLYVVELHRRSKLHCAVPFFGVAMWVIAPRPSARHFQVWPSSSDT